MVAVGFRRLKLGKKIIKKKSLQLNCYIVFLLHLLGEGKRVREKLFESKGRLVSTVSALIKGNKKLPLV